MTRQDCLNAASSAFLQTCTTLLPAMLEAAKDRLFERAEHATSMQLQGLLLDSRTVLSNESNALQDAIVLALQPLLERSLQTAFSSYRPSYADRLNQSLSLVSMQAVESEMRLDGICRQLREHAGEQLSDLTIRITVLFGQTHAIERENPFRPYLLAKGLANGVERMAWSRDISDVLIDQLALSLYPSAAQIYQATNQSLAELGVPAELPLQVVQRPERTPRPTPAATPMPEAPPEPDQLASPGSNTPSPEAMLMQMVQRRSMPRPTGAASSAMSTGEMPQAAQPSVSMQASAPSSEQEGWGSWLIGPQQVGAMLRGLFQGEESISAGDATASPPLVATELESSLVQSISTLQQAATPDSQHMRDAHGQLRNLILENRSYLGSLTSHPQELMVIDLVSMLFELILRDGKVPTDVRTQLGRMQFLVLKQALTDPTLLTQKQHPARQLVNRIGSISLGLQQIDPSGERVTQEISHIVETLLQDDAPGTERFTRMLDQLESFISHVLNSQDAPVHQTLQALATADKRSARLGQIVLQLTDAIGELQISPLLWGFLSDTWARVIERAEQSDLLQSQVFRACVPRLLWSAEPKLTEEDRRQLTRALPALVNTLRSGMQFIGQPAAETDQLMRNFSGLHRQALQANPLQLPGLTLTAFEQRFHAFIHDNPPDAAPHSDAAEPHPLVRNEELSQVAASIEVLDSQHDAVRSIVNEYLYGSEPSVQFDKATEQSALERLRIGVAVEVNLDGRPQRAVLSWVDPDEPRMVIRIGDHPTPSVMTVKLFLQLIRIGRARFLEDRPLFERAVTLLLENADKVDRSRAA